MKYNLGNVEYQQALQNLQRPQEAMPHLRSAMTYYRDSLEVDPQQQERAIISNRPICYSTSCNRSSNGNRSSNRGSPRTCSSKTTTATSKRSQPQGQQPQSQQQDGVATAARPAHQQSNNSRPPQPRRQASKRQQRQDASQENAPPPGQQTAAQRELRPEEAARLLEAIRERSREADNQRQQRRSKTQASQVDKDW